MRAQQHAVLGAVLWRRPQRPDSPGLCFDVIDAAGLTGEERDRLGVMAGVSAFPMRVKCATLAWHAMKAALEHEGRAKTE